MRIDFYFEGEGPAWVYGINPAISAALQSVAVESVTISVEVSDGAPLPDEQRRGGVALPGAEEANVTPLKRLIRARAKEKAARNGDGLTDEQWIELMQRNGEGEKPKALSKEYGVSVASIYTKKAVMKKEGTLPTGGPKA